MNEQIEIHNISRSRLAALARKYWLLVLAVMLGGTVGMYVVLQVFFTEVYESKTRLLVKVGRENVETPATVRNGQVFSQGVRAADINSEVQILSAGVLLERVVRELGVERFQSVLTPPESWLGYPKYWAKLTARKVKAAYKEALIALALDKRLSPEQEALMRLADGVKVEPVKDSDILMLRLRTPSPALCVDASNALLSAYMEERTAVRRTPAGSQFFESRMREAFEAMSRQQARRAAIRDKWTVSGDPGEQRKAYLEQIAKLEAELAEGEGELAKLKSQAAQLSERSRSMPEMITKEVVEAPNPNLQSIRERITTLKLEHAKLASRYQPESEMMRKIDDEIAELEQSLRQETPTITNARTTENNPARRDFRARSDVDAVQASALESKLNQLRRPLNELKQELRRLDLAIDEMEQAEREYRRAEQDYLFYAKRLEEARMSEELDSQRVTNVSIIERPETPILPVAPRKLFLLGIALTASALIGLGLAAILETTEDRVRSETDLLDLPGVPYLGTLAVSETRI
jgi:uncharacterized protein involved in exopolysaccharide biosynthesis